MTDLQYDEVLASRAVKFFGGYLRHVKGEKAGQPLNLAKWQREDIIEPLFGWQTSEHVRRYRTAYIEIPRKNGKSTLAAGIALYLLLADGEAGAEVYSAAADRDQASIVFDMAVRMIEAHPSLSARCKVYRTKTIIVKETGAVYKALSSDAFTKHGLNAHGIVFDELHAQKDSELWDVLTTSVAARKQPLTVAITTAGYDRNSLCWQIHEYAERVRDGQIDDPSFLPVIYASEPGSDWRDERTWASANPGLGESVRMDYLRQACATAVDAPARENTFRRLHLNQWTEQDVRWIPMHHWRECCGEPIDEAKIEALKKIPCYGGLDLSSVKDLSAFVLYWPTTKDVLAWFWMPADSMMTKMREDRVPYPQWVKDGHVIAHPGRTVNFDKVRADIKRLAGGFRCVSVGVDRWQAEQMRQQLTADGFVAEPFGQGFASMSAPSKELERLVVEREIQHHGNPVLDWMAGNVTVETDPAGNIKPTKARSTGKIDGIVALVMAIGRSLSASEVKKPSLSEILKQRGALRIGSKYGSPSEQAKKDEQQGRA